MTCTLTALALWALGAVLFWEALEEDTTRRNKRLLLAGLSVFWWLVVAWAFIHEAVLRGWWLARVAAYRIRRSRR